MSDQPNLVTTCSFKGKEYLVKMNIISGNSLEMSVTDKYTTEEWQCCYDANYIENITHKTGNFKQFDIFTTMLKSGLLKTSECVSLDLLTYDDLEMLRNRRMNGRNLCPSHSVHSNNVNATSNRRYLILTYSVEFDRIHYPLPMEYCGPPNPQVLQGIIHRLEGEVERLQEQLKKQAEQGPTNNTSHISKLQKRIEDLSAENKTLSEDVRYLNKALSKHSNSMRHIGMMKGIVNSLQEQVIKDRMISHRQIKRLQEEKAVLKQQVQVLRHSERQLRIQLKNSLRGRSPVHPAYVPISSQSAERLNPSLTSRHPGDGRGSPLKNTEYASQKLRCREVSRSPNWRRNLRENNNLHQVKPVVPTAQRIVSPSRTQNVCCLQPSSLRCCRSSSESSCGSRNHISSQCTIIRKVKHPDNVATQLAVSLQKQNNQDRGRPRQRTIFCKTRNTSGSSVESVNVRQLRENNSKKKAINCSRESSGGSTSSRCKVKRKESPGTGDHEVLRPNEPKCYQSSKDLKLGMSDLESRIQALQKLLKEGLSLKA